MCSRNQITIGKFWQRSGNRGGKTQHYTIHKLDYSTIQSFYIIKKVKRNPHTRRKCFSTHINGKGFKPRIYF